MRRFERLNGFEFEEDELISKSAAQGLAQYRIPVSQITALGSIWRKTS